MRRDTVRRDVSLVVAGASVIVGAGVVLMLATSVGPGTLGVDLHALQDASRSWLAGHGFYPAHQLVGPYVLTGGSATNAGDTLYPPPMLLLLLPFLALPEILWWAIPVGLLSWALYRLRPAAWTWPVMTATMLWPPSLQAILDGNPLIWVVAAVALGPVYGWPAVFVLLKPTLAPFALIGARRRSWWIVLGVLALASLPFGALWADWLRAAVINPTNGGLGYSLVQVPALCAPLVAWLGRSRVPKYPRSGAGAAEGLQPS